MLQLQNGRQAYDIINFVKKIYKLSIGRVTTPFFEFKICPKAAQPNACLQKFLIKT